MGAERHGSKRGGGYVGGFLQLFDWNAKSRKKLFSSKSDSPGRVKNMFSVLNMPLLLGLLVLLFLSFDLALVAEEVWFSFCDSCRAFQTEKEM